jgi:hypothetical protein
MRFIAFGAGLAGFVALSAQASMTAIMTLLPDLADYVPLAIQVGRWAQLAFILLLSVFLFLFALSKRSA